MLALMVAGFCEVSAISCLLPHAVVVSKNVPSDLHSQFICT